MNMTSLIKGKRRIFLMYLFRLTFN